MAVCDDHLPLGEGDLWIVVAAEVVRQDTKVWAGPLVFDRGWLDPGDVRHSAAEGDCVEIAPRLPLVIAHTDGHAVASGVRRVGKEYRIPTRVSEYTRLAARVDERLIFSHFAPCLAAIAAKRDGSIVRSFGLIYPSMVADTEQ